MLRLLSSVVTLAVATLIIAAPLPPASEANPLSACSNLSRRGQTASSCVSKNNALLGAITRNALGRHREKWQLEEEIHEEDRTSTQRYPGKPPGRAAILNSLRPQNVDEGAVMAQLGLDLQNWRKTLAARYRELGHQAHLLTSIPAYKVSGQNQQTLSRIERLAALFETKLSSEDAESKDAGKYLQVLEQNNEIVNEIEEQTKSTQVEDEFEWGFEPADMQGSDNEAEGELHSEAFGDANEVD